MRAQRMAMVGMMMALFLGSGCKGLGPRDEQPRALATLSGLDGNRANGRLTFTPLPQGLLIQGDLYGLIPGKHGIHIHEHGDCGGGSGSAAGSHFNPLNGVHGPAAVASSHAGDLGNLVADDQGHAQVRIEDLRLKLDGDQGILGRSIIVHAMVDDLASQPAGGSGPRIACGQITAATR